MTKFCELPYKTVELEESNLSFEKSKDFLRAIQKCTSAHFIECKKEENGEREVVIFDLEIPLGQNALHDIRYVERLAVQFRPLKNSQPWVYALREDFPKLPHLLLGETEYPRSLCIYEESYQESVLNWRSEKFIEDITVWLYLNAYGKLHQKDQPLEPLLNFTEGSIIVPIDLKNGERLFLYLRDSIDNRVNLLASKKSMDNERVAIFHSMLVVGKPQEHGGLNKYPKTLFDLAEFFKKAKIDFPKTLIEELKTHKEDKSKRPFNLLILAYLPKTGINETTVSGYDYYAFLVNGSLEEIGIKLGLWQKFENKLADVFQPEIDWDKTKEIAMGVLTPYLEHSKSAAALFNKIDKQDQELNITLIGVGALGSQLFMNLSRMGFGKWTLVDNDLLLPHNLGRHALYGGTGFSKSQLLSAQANALLNSTDHSVAIWDNFLNPQKPEELIELLNSSEIILDISTSVAVEREVIDNKYGGARRISMFLNPKGTDLVILAEGKERDIQLDILEFQFYRHLLYSPSIQDHLAFDEDSVRYSNSCRDASNRIPQDYIGTLSSIASIKIRHLVKGSDPFIGLWRIREDEIEAVFHSIDTYPVRKLKVSNWEVCIDEYLINKMAQARLSKLPNETGGILIGGYDLQRRKIYILDTILSPKDSYEYPTAYIRGIEGVQKNLEFIQRITNDNLKYIGEWHSHPTGASINPSSDDVKLFAWLKGEMEKIGLPPVMMIVGTDGSFNIFVDEIN